MLYENNHYTTLNFTTIINSKGCMCVDETAGQNWMTYSTQK